MQGPQRYGASRAETLPRTYKLLLAAVLVIPMALALAFAWWNWVRVNAETEAGMMQRVDMLHENALRLMQSDEILLARIDDRVAGLSWPGIIADRREISNAVAGMAAGIGEVEAVALADPAGKVEIEALRGGGGMVVNAVPAQANVRSQSYFRAAEAGAGIAIDSTATSPLTGHSSITIARRLSSRDGAFRGVAIVAISPERVTEFWHRVVLPGDSVSLIRDDGLVLARIPELRGNAPRRVAPFAVRALHSGDRGEFEQPSSIFDGTSRHVAFRKLAGYPIYTVYGVDRQNIVSNWYPTTMAFAGLAIVASLALFFVARAVVRQASALRESEARYRGLYDYTPVPMHACDIDGNIVAVSERWLDLMGYTRDEVIGRSIKEFRPPDGAAALLDGGWQHAVAAGGVRDIERKLVRKTGEILDVLISSRAEYDGEGRFRRMAVVVIDQTEKKRIENALRHVQKMEAVGQLTGGIAHDFNNLLTVIGGNLDMLRLKLPSADPDLTRLVDAALRGAKRASTLTQRLLAFSRRQPLDPKPINPNRLVSGMSDMLGRTLGETVAIETVLGGGVWWVEADENQLENTLLNLAVNARDAMPNGGKLTIETANTYLDESYAAANEDVKPGQYVLIAVSDTGQGMSEEVIAKAFEPFFTTKTAGHGTGLGLSQAYGFIKQSGGHVKIYSEVEQGTTVKLYLPRLAARDVAETAADSQPVSTAVSGRTILVVEDDEDVRTFAAELLTQLGHQVLTAADGAAALRLAEENPDIDLLFTDVGLPAPYNGRQLAEKALRLRPKMRVLFTTGYARNAIVHHGRLDADVDLIVKPYTQADLAAKIRDVLERDRPARGGAGRPAISPVKSPP